MYALITLIASIAAKRKAAKICAEIELIDQQIASLDALEAKLNNLI